MGKEEFVFVGNRPHIRLDAELAQINKEEADQAFKKYKKEMIDPLLLGQGFSRWKSSAYVRRNRIGLLEFINLQKERYGSKTFCVNFAVMPLYCGYTYPILSLGHRLGTYLSGVDIWWDYGSEQAAEQSFQNVAEAIAKFVFPWLLVLSTEEGYRTMLAEFKKDHPEIAQKWLDALEIEEKEPLIQSSIHQLKLPKKLLKP